MSAVPAQAAQQIRALLKWGAGYDFPGYPEHPSFLDALAAFDEFEVAFTQTVEWHHRAEQGWADAQAALDALLARVAEAEAAVERVNTLTLNPRYANRMLTRRDSGGSWRGVTASKRTRNIRQVKNRPPLQHCPYCGTHHYAWQEQAPCARCVKERAEDRSALVSIVREQRLARRARLGL